MGALFSFRSLFNKTDTLQQVARGLLFGANLPNIESDSQGMISRRSSLAVNKSEAEEAVPASFQTIG